MESSFGERFFLCCIMINSHCFSHTAALALPLPRFSEIEILVQDDIGAASLKLSNQGTNFFPMQARQIF